MAQPLLFYIFMITIENIINDHSKIIASQINHFTSNQEDRHDLFQDTLLEIHRSLPAFRYQSEIKTWVYTIARRTSIKGMKKKLNQKETDCTLSSPSTPHEEYERKETSKTLVQIINRLEDPIKKVIKLHLHTNTTIKEMSKETGLTPSNIKVIIHRSLKYLKQRVNYT